MVLRCLCSIEGADRQIIEIELVLRIKGGKDIDVHFLHRDAFPCGRSEVDDGDLPRRVVFLLLSFMLDVLLLRVKLSKMALVLPKIESSSDNGRSIEDASPGLAARSPYSMRKR